MIERECETCGEHFFAKPYLVRQGRGRFCSLKCFGASPHHISHSPLGGQYKPLSAKADSFSLPGPGEGGREVWPVYDGPTAYIDRSDGISGGGVPARYTGEKGLRRAVTLIDTTAYGASARGVSWVNQFHDHTDEAGLVLDKASELAERPGVMLSPLALANRDPVSDAREVFKGNTATGVFGLRNNPLTEHVVDISGKTCLFARTLYQKPLGCLRAVGLEFPSQFGMAFSQTVHLASGVGFSVGIGGNIDDAKVDAQKALGVVGVWFGGIDHHGQVEGLISEDKVGLPDNAVESRFLVGTDAHGYEFSSLKGKDGYPVGALPGEDTLVIDHGAVGLESVNLGLILAVALDHLTDNPDCHLCRKTIMLTKVAICKVVELHLRGCISLESKLRDVVAGLVESLHRFKQGLILFGVRCEFDH